MPHDRIGFENLAKEIGQRWKQLDKEQINYYKVLAVKEKTQYKEAMQKFWEENEGNSIIFMIKDAFDEGDN